VLFVPIKPFLQTTKREDTSVMAETTQESGVLILIYLSVFIGDGIEMVFHYKV
jgi:hypothetical protein